MKTYADLGHTDVANLVLTFTYVSIWEAIDAYYSIQCIWYNNKEDERDRMKTPSILRIVYSTWHFASILWFLKWLMHLGDAVVVVGIDRDGLFQIWIENWCR